MFWSFKKTRNEFRNYNHHYMIHYTCTEEEHSVEEVLERPTGYPKVGGSNHGSGDFSLQPQRNPYLS